MAARIAFAACLGSTLFMTGLIWFVHVVHYPLMAKVGADGFRAYHADHTRLTGSVVGGPMLVELVSAAWLVFADRPRDLPFAWAVAGLVLALVTWGVTGLQSVPAHNRLALGFDAATHRRLVATDLTRALAWTGHAAVLLAATWRMID